MDLIENSKGVERTDSDQKRKIDGAQRLRTQRSSALWPENFTRNRNSKLVDSLATNGVRGFRHRGQKIGWKAEREARRPNLLTSVHETPDPVSSERVHELRVPIASKVFGPKGR